MAEVNNDEQSGFEDIVVDDADITSLLGEFMGTKAEVSAANKAHRENKVKLNDLVEREGWTGNQRIRCGPYLVVITETEAKAVAFERSAGQRVLVTNAD